MIFRFDNGNWIICLWKLLPVNWTPYAGTLYKRLSDFIAAVMQISGRYVYERGKLFVSYNNANYEIRVKYLYVFYFIF